ncbi:hypothetical protein Rcae01_06721 [Novipirellula caenicola]|uniref:Uncharacterized protein n=1 Tax=Novipirellula caenicola TaxID=1536901 RepID=A0ABP9W3X3_9BACT
MVAVAFRPVGGPSSRQPLGSTSDASVTDCDDKMLHDQNRGFCLARQRWHESQISAGHAASCDNAPDQRGPGVGHPFVKTDHRFSGAYDRYP